MFCGCDSDAPVLAENRWKSNRFLASKSWIELIGWFTCTTCSAFRAFCVECLLCNRWRTRKTFNQSNNDDAQIDTISCGWCKFADRLCNPIHSCAHRNRWLWMHSPIQNIVCRGYFIPMLDVDISKHSFEVLQISPRFRTNHWQHFLLRKFQPKIPSLFPFPPPTALRRPFSQLIKWKKKQENEIIFFSIKNCLYSAAVAVQVLSRAVAIAYARLAMLTVDRPCVCVNFPSMLFLFWFYQQTATVSSDGGGKTIFWPLRRFVRLN